LPGDAQHGKRPKNSQLVLRLPKADRDAFVDLCERLDTSAAREIRRFIRDFTAEHGVTPEAEPEGDPSPDKKSRKKKARRAEKS
jgi:hypothetical protein